MDRHKEIMRLMREDFDPTPAGWEGREWNDNAEDVATKIAALCHREVGAVRLGLPGFSLAALQFALDGLANEIGAVFVLGKDGSNTRERPSREPRLHVLSPLSRARQLSAPLLV